MISLVPFFATLLLLHPNTCPDFSGTYVIQGEDGRVRITISQTDCSKLSLEWRTPSASVINHLVLDGTARSAPAWFGIAGSHWISAQMRDSVLELRSHSRVQITDSQLRLEWRALFQFISANDLCVTHLARSWASVAVAARNATNDKKGEDAAALRSGFRFPPTAHCKSS
jgi:hypothetical protein